MATHLTNARFRTMKPGDATEWHYQLLATGWYAKRWLRLDLMHCELHGPYETRDDAERAMAMWTLEHGG